MKDIDTVKRVRSWKHRQGICDFTYYKSTPFDILKSDFIAFSFEKGEGYPGYKQGEIEFIDYQNPINLWTKMQE